MPGRIFNINGSSHDVDVDSEVFLLSLLRDHLGLTGTKYGCGEAQCGACTVLIDGSPRRSCVTPAQDVAGKQITTIEGLSRNGELHAVQSAFAEHNAFQCGYCTAGMIMSAAGLLSSKPHPTDEEIIKAMNGNICRCGTYPRILDAIRDASRKMGTGATQS